MPVLRASDKDFPARLRAFLGNGEAAEDRAERADEEQHRAERAAQAPEDRPDRHEERHVRRREEEKRPLHEPAVAADLVLADEVPGGVEIGPQDMEQGEDGYERDDKADGKPGRVDRSGWSLHRGVAFVAVVDRADAIIARSSENRAGEDE